MIPSNNPLLTTDLQIVTLPSKTYKIHIDRNQIFDYTDGIDAMIQAIYKILNTERYQYIMYSWNYGIELYDLYGKRVDYVCAELQRRIEEALLQDDRILAVDGFEFDTSVKKVVNVTFTVHTIFGDVEGEKAVTI